MSVASGGTISDILAIGNALALEGGLSVTQGIVSALDRSIDTKGETVTGLIQIDDAIARANQMIAGA